MNEEQFENLDDLVWNKRHQLQLRHSFLKAGSPIRNKQPLPDVIASTTAPDANDTNTEVRESSRVSPPSDARESITSGARPKIPPRPSNLKITPASLSCEPSLSYFRNTSATSATHEQPCRRATLAAPPSDSTPQKQRSRILPAAALKDKPAGSFLLSRRSKDCACAVHVIHDDRRVTSVKFDSAEDGFVQRGSESKRVYGAVEDFIVEHGELFRNPVAEVGDEDNLTGIDIVKKCCVNSCQNFH